ncbi:hypothetical protein [Flavobacterium sp. 3HN19-14]|uniref:hypothetical protein n=1 Tax=Flavobacterium sp. 3HN19-14 TaxID=3448133 RepID=UPI003EE3A104
MKAIIKISFLMACCFPLAMSAQQKLYVGQPIYIGSGAKLFTQNYEVKFNADITTAISPKGLLVAGANTTFTGTGDLKKVNGYIKNNFPHDLGYFPLGTNSITKALNLIVENNDVPVIAGYMPGSPQSPTSIDSDLQQISGNGHWDIQSTAQAKITLAFNDVLEPLVAEFGLSRFSIAGWDGTQWSLLPATILPGNQHIRTNDFVDSSVYSNFAFAIRDCALSTTWNGTAWSNGTPDSFDYAVIIDGDYDTSTFGDITSCSLRVNADAVVNIDGDTFFIVNGFFSIDDSASVTIHDDGALVQVADVADYGLVTVTQDIFIRGDDNLFIGAPVSGQNVRAFSPSTLEDNFFIFSETENSFEPLFIPVASGGAGADPVTFEFPPGEGIVVGAPADFFSAPAAVQPFVSTWHGTPHNGDIEVSVSNDGLGFNFLANPYPSPIDATIFLEANPGTISIWTVTDLGLESSSAFAAFNLAGATDSFVSFVIGEPATGAPVGVIETGKGFLMETGSTEDLVFFSNDMRIPNPSSLRTTLDDRSRIWLNLSDATKGYNQIMIGYMNNVTNGFDPSYDGKQPNSGHDDFESHWQSKLRDTGASVAIFGYGCCAAFFFNGGCRQLHHCH